MQLMGWAKRWQKVEGWDHRLRVMLGFDEKKVRWHRQNVHLGTLARMWKSYLTDSGAAYKQTSSGRASPGGLRP